MTRWALIATLVPMLAMAGAGDPCDDGFDECKDTCSIEFGGSIKDSAKKKFAKCVKKCTKTANNCHERAMETSRNNLDEGALAHSPGSREVDENGMPDRTTGAKAREEVPPRRDDDVGAKGSRAPKEEKVEKKPRETLKDEEVPKSSRTKLDKVDKSEKVEPVKTSPKEGKAKDPEPREPEKPKEIRVEAKPDKGPRLDEDLRDDGSRAVADEPKKKPEKRREEPREEPRPVKKDKEEDHDDLRNY
jgi:hypothetical protein